jgi:hypothetical protein
LRWQSDTQDRPTLTVTLQNDSQLPAALAVLKALYGGKPVQDLLAGLSLQQQMHAAVLADMWQLQAVSDAATETLQAALTHLKSAAFLQAAMQEVLSLPSLPACLMPCIQKMIRQACDSKLMYHLADTDSGRAHRASLQQLLLHMLGDLEAVWHSSTLTEMLLELPAAAMKLLLASDDLMVRASSATNYNCQVMYGTTTFIGSQPESGCLTVVAHTTGLDFETYHNPNSKEYCTLSAHSASKVLHTKPWVEMTCSAEYVRTPRPAPQQSNASCHACRWRPRTLSCTRPKPGSTTASESPA